MAPKVNDAEMSPKMTSLEKEVQACKQLEVTLEESERRYRALFEQSADAIIIHDLKGQIIDANPKALEMLGYARERFHWMTITMIHPETERVRSQKALQKTQKEGNVRFESQLQRANGNSLAVEISSRIVDAGKGIVQWVISDTSERKLAEKALRAREERYRLLIENINDVIFAVDDNGRLIYISSFIKSISGYSPSELIDRPFADFIHIDDRSAVIQRFQKYHSGVLKPGEFRIMTKSGEARWVRAYGRPVYDGDRATGLRGVLTDITETKRLEAQLFQGQKMEAIGTLAGGIVHDFNNILHAMIGYCELSLAEVEKSTNIHGHLQEVLKAGQRAKDLVQRVLPFSRQAEPEFKPVKIETIVREALKVLRDSIPATIEIRQELQSDCLVLGDPTQIHQVVINLCTNASRALQPKGGLMAVRLASEELGSTSKYYALRPGKYVKLTVSDTGHGMDPDVLDKIFNPFFTTKEKGEGTGMGLSVVHGIVKSHGGDILAFSEPGKGSEFYVYFPVIERKLKLDPGLEEPLPTGTERILLVDDKQTIVNMEKQSLETLGYDVSTRTSSVEALQLFKAQPDRFDLIITDMTMPNMTGEKLAQALMQIRPGIPVILCTGFSANIDEEKALSMGIRAFISKPILKREIANTIRAVLGG